MEVKRPERQVNHSTPYTDFKNEHNYRHTLIPLYAFMTWPNKSLHLIQNTKRTDKADSSISKLNLPKYVPVRRLNICATVYIGKSVQQIIKQFWVL
jgi:hypothetical protein